MAAPATSVQLSSISFVCVCVAVNVGAGSLSALLRACVRDFVKAANAVGSVSLDLGPALPSPFAELTGSGMVSSRNLPESNMAPAIGLISAIARALPAPLRPGPSWIAASEGGSRFRVFLPGSVAAGSSGKACPPEALPMGSAASVADGAFATPTP